MSAQFVLTQSATKDIDEIADYIAQQSGFGRAKEFLIGLDAKFEKISKFPNIGRLRNEVSTNVRSFPIDSYLIFYIPTGGGVEILRVVSSYRDIPAMFEN